VEKQCIFSRRPTSNTNKQFAYLSRLSVFGNGAVNRGVVRGNFGSVGSDES